MFKQFFKDEYKWLDSTCYVMHTFSSFFAFDIEIQECTRINFNQFESINEWAIDTSNHVFVGYEKDRYYRFKFR